MNDYREIGERLKTARIAAGYKSAREFCKQNNIPSSTYCMHENGNRGINHATAKRYSELLGVDFSWLMVGSGSPFCKNEIDEPPIPHDKFIDYLRIDDINLGSSPSDEVLLSKVNPFILIRISNGVARILQSFNITIDYDAVTKKSVEIYNDIIKTTKSTKNQLLLVNLSLNTLETEIKKLANKIKKSV